MNTEAQSVDIVRSILGNHGIHEPDDAVVTCGPESDDFVDVMIMRSGIPRRAVGLAICGDCEGANVVSDEMVIMPNDQPPVIISIDPDLCEGLAGEVLVWIKGQVKSNGREVNLPECFCPVGRRLSAKKVTRRQLGGETLVQIVLYDEGRKVCKSSAQIVAYEVARRMIEQSATKGGEQ